MKFFGWLVNLILVGRKQPAPIPSKGQDGLDVLIDTLNVERAKNRLGALREDAQLIETAGWWAAAMAKDETLSHGDFPNRIAAAYPNTAAGEDIAEGASDVQAVVALWMASPPHRANILGNFNAAGAGRAAASDGTIYWCVDFAELP